MVYTCSSTVIHINLWIMKKIILASASPRRKEILAKTGLEFEVAESGYKEDMSLDLEPRELAKFLSKGKVQALADKYKNHIIIGADTFVVDGDKLLGKASSKQEIEQMLEKLSAKQVRVITGLSVLDTSSQKIVSRAVETVLTMKSLSKTQIRNYAHTLEGIGKAGGFGIQGIGAALIEKIEGDFFNVMGLPLSKLADVLVEFGIEII